MTQRDIITCPEVGLVQDEQGRYVVSKSGQHPYKLKPESRMHSIVRILDNRCAAQQRRCVCANVHITELERKLKQIEDSVIYKFLHKIGLL